MVKINRFLYAVMFLEPLGISFSAFSAIAKLKDHFNQDFDGIDPIQAYPAELRNQIPVEAPRYILNSNHLNIVITGNRIDFNILATDIELKYISERIAEIQEVISEISLPPFRIGVFLEGDINKETVQSITEEFVFFDRLSEMVEWQLSYREIKTIGAFSYNRWKRYFLIKEDSVVKFNYDVNNLNGISSTDIKENNTNILKLVGELIGS